MSSSRPLPDTRERLASAPRMTPVPDERSSGAAVAEAVVRRQLDCELSDVAASKDVLCQAVVGICGFVSEVIIRAVAGWAGRWPDGSGMVTVTCRWKARWRLGS
jgi:hypothetical protein